MATLGRPPDIGDGLCSTAGRTVVALDKLDNARAILRDYRVHGPELWKRFSVHDPQQHLWYYRSLLVVYKTRNSTWLVAELERVLGELEDLVTASE